MLNTAAVISSVTSTPGDGQVILQWNIDSETCPIEYYTLQYELIRIDGCQDVNEGRVEPITINMTDTSYNVTGLQTFATYSFYLTPYNVIGEGAEIRFENITTNEQGKTRYCFHV